MSLKFLLLAVVAVLTMEQSSAGLMDKMTENPMVSAMLPPGCKESINGIMKKAEKTYKMILEKCKNDCKGKPLLAKNLWPLEPHTIAAVKGVFNSLEKYTKTPLVIDKICPENLKYKDIWIFYEEGKKKCIKAVGEFDGHKNLCESKKEDFKKTEKCIEDYAMGEFKKRTNPLPFECATAALKKYCNKEYMGWVELFYFDEIRKNLEHKLFIKPHVNPWKFMSIFKYKCSGKVDM